MKKNFYLVCMMLFTSLFTISCSSDDDSNSTDIVDKLITILNKDESDVAKLATELSLPNRIEKSSFIYYTTSPDWAGATEMKYPYIKIEKSNNLVTYVEYHIIVNGSDQVNSEALKLLNMVKSKPRSINNHSLTYGSSIFIENNKYSYPSSIQLSLTMLKSTTRHFQSVQSTWLGENNEVLNCVTSNERNDGKTHITINAQLE